MTTQTAQHTVIAGVPRVNLMPPEIAVAERFRQVQLLMGSVVVLAALGVGAFYVHERTVVSNAQSQLVFNQQRAGTLHTQLAGLSTIATTLADVHTKQGLLQDAMSQEIRWSYYLNDLSFRIPNNVWLTGVTASETSTGVATSTAATTTPTTATPGAPTSIGSVDLTGVAFRHNDVANWLDALAKINGFADPSFSHSTESAIGSQGVVDFDTSVQVTPDALSHRYTPQAGN